MLEHRGHGDVALKVREGEFMGHGSRTFEDVRIGNRQGLRIVVVMDTHLYPKLAIRWFAYDKANKLLAKEDSGEVHMNTWHRPAHTVFEWVRQYLPRTAPSRKRSRMSRSASS